MVIPIALWWLPADYFDEGVSLCPSQWIYGISCYGCGSTRAFMHLHHFEVFKAWNMNRGIFIYYPFFVIIWGLYVLGALRKLGWVHPKEWQHVFLRVLADYIPNRP